MLAKVFKAVSGEVRRIPQRMLPAKKALIYATHPNKYLARRHAAEDLPPRKEHLPLLARLQNDGFSLANEIMNDELLAQLTQAVEKKLQNVDDLAGDGRKDFWKRLLAPEDLNENSIFVNYSMQDSVLRIVSRYFGQIPYLANVSLIVSDSSETEAWKKSQLWHKDYNDSRCLKYWTYFSDVKDEGDGPFTFIPAKYSRQVKARRFPVHKPDKHIEKYGAFDKRVQVTGPKHTSFFIDTYRCFHRGSRVSTGHRRVAFVATYVTFASYYPYKNHIQWNSNMSNLEGLVLRS